MNVPEQHDSPFPEGETTAAGTIEVRVLADGRRSYRRRFRRDGRRVSVVLHEPPAGAATTDHGRR